MATKSTPSKTPSKSTAAAKAPAKPEPKAAVKPPTKDAKPDPKSTSKVAAAAPAAKAKVEAKPEPKAAVPAKKTDDRASDPKASVSKEEPMTLPRIAAAAPVPEERVSITTTISKAQLQRFRKLLEDKRDDIIKKAKETLEEDMALDTNDLPDEMDLASSEYLQSFTFRLRGREKSFLDKINKALERIENNSFGMCEECGDEISVKRLEARPETTLCIRCKEDQERAEKDYG
jgi:DnaK suppressor protein